MQAEFNPTTSKGKTAAIESYREVLSSEHGLSLWELCSRSGIDN